MIGISNKINIESPVRNKIKPDCFYGIHFLIKNADLMICTDIFIDQDITVHFSDYLKIHITCIFPVKIRNSY